MAHGRGRRVLPVTIISLVVLTTACSGGSAQPGPADPATSAPPPSATPSPVAAAPPEPEPPALPRATKGAAGQKAFARYVMDAWAWSLRTNDAGPLLDVSPSKKQPCKGCGPLVKELDKRADEGWYVDFPGLIVDRTRLKRTGDAVVATSRVDIPASETFYEDGTYRSSNPAHDDATFVVRMQRVKGVYRLVSFSVG